MNKNKTKE